MRFELYFLVSVWDSPEIIVVGQGLPLLFIGTSKKQAGPVTLLCSQSAFQ